VEEQLPAFSDVWVSEHGIFSILYSCKRGVNLLGSLQLCMIRVHLLFGTCIV
jgi:hypothetical protein